MGHPATRISGGGILQTPLAEVLCGHFLHHGCWVKGVQDREEAVLETQSRIETALQLQSGQRLFEIGCGTGAFLGILEEKYQLETVGIDLVAPPGADFFEDDFHTMELPPRHYDRVLSLEVLSHSENIEMFFRQVALTLAPKGRMILADWFPAANLSPIERWVVKLIATQATMAWPTFEATKRAINEAGLRILNQEDWSRQTAETWTDFLTRTAKCFRSWKLTRAVARAFLRFPLLLLLTPLIPLLYATGALSYQMAAVEK